jgi:hypothetical protein
MLNAVATLEDVQNCWISRPCNLRHSNAPVGSKHFFDEVEDSKYFVEPHIPDFANFSTLSEKRVLEIGCRIGTNATNFAKVGATYTGGVLHHIPSLENALKVFITSCTETRFLK